MAKSKDGTVCSFLKMDLIFFSLLVFMRHLTSCAVRAVRSIMPIVRNKSNSFHLKSIGARSAPLIFSGRVYRWLWMQAKKIY